MTFLYVFSKSTFSWVVLSCVQRYGVEGNLSGLLTWWGEPATRSGLGP